MASKKNKTTTTKVKKKKWFPIHAPAHFNSALLGETYVTEQQLVGQKYLTANLSTIVRSMRKQNINIQFRVNKLDEGKAYTEIVGYWLINSAIRRVVRRGRDKVTDSFLAKTKDKKVIRIKPLYITLNKGTRSVRTAMRLEGRRVIREYAFSKTVEEIFSDIIDGKLQKLLKQNIGKITPVKNIEMRMAKLQENVKVILTEDGVKTEAVNIKKKDKGEKHAVEEDEPVIESSQQDSEDIQDLDTEDDSESFGEDVKETKEVSTDEDDELQDEEEDLIEAGEEKADETTEIADEPETILEEVDKEESESSKKQKEE